jgi:ketosteroid isomerase-like protein
MKASRRVYTIAATLAAVTFAVSSLSTILAHAQSADAAAVEQAGETLRKLMINPDQPALEQIFADQLSYGHSDGRVQTKAEFVDALVDGKSVFKSISLTGQTVSIVGDIAILRHRFEADAVSNGTPSRPRIKVLQVWQKQDGVWRLLVRQAH